MLAFHSAKVVVEWVMMRSGVNSSLAARRQKLRKCVVVMNVGDVVTVARPTLRSSGIE